MRALKKKYYFIKEKKNNSCFTNRVSQISFMQMNLLCLYLNTVFKFDIFKTISIFFKILLIIPQKGHQFSDEIFRIFFNFKFDIPRDLDYMCQR